MSLQDPNGPISSQQTSNSLSDQYDLTFEARGSTYSNGHIRVEFFAGDTSVLAKKVKVSKQALVAIATAAELQAANTAGAGRIELDFSGNFDNGWVGNASGFLVEGINGNGHLEIVDNTLIFVF